MRCIRTACGSARSVSRSASSSLRGAIDGWYVYDFLDPTLDGGWPAALTTTAQVLVAFLIVAVVLHVAGSARAALAVRHGRR